MVFLIPLLNEFSHLRFRAKLHSVIDSKINAVEHGAAHPLAPGRSESEGSIDHDEVGEQRK